MKEILLFILLALTYTSKGQKYIVSLNSNYLISSASIKDAWNVVGGNPDYKSLNGYSIGLDLAMKPNDKKKHNSSLSLDLLNHGIEGPNSWIYLRQYERFSYLKFSTNNFFRITSRIDLNVSPNLNYLTSFNSFSINSIKKYKHNNYFGQGFNSNSIEYNKLFYGLTIGFQYKLKQGKIRFNYNPALVSTLHLKNAEHFRLYLTNYEIGVSSYLFRF